MACISCRQSKVKCDSKVPCCSHCASKKKECRYQTSDKRRLPLRVAIELLVYRVDQLCQFLHEHGLQTPKMPADKDATLQRILDTLGMTGKAVSPIPPPMPPSMVQHDEWCSHNPTIAANEASSEGLGKNNLNRQRATNLPVIEQDDCWSDSGLSPIPQNNGMGLMVPECHPSDLTGESPSSIFNTWLFDLEFGTHITSFASEIQRQPIVGASSNDELNVPLKLPADCFGHVYSESGSAIFRESASTFDIEGLVDEISDRVGTLKIGPGGKTRYYGPTSTFNLRDMPSSSDYDIGQTILNCDSGSEEEIPAALEDQLLGHYFRWQDPSLHVVDQSIYQEGKEKWNNMEETPYYSEALRYAMCALGSAFEPRYHPTIVTFPKTLVDFFGDRAKSRLETELDSPSVATIQAMVILSSHEIGNGKDTRGLLYSGSALRLAFDLGLHLDMSSYVSTGMISAAHANLRRTVFWAAYIIDHQLGFHLGKLFRTSMEIVTVGKPRQDEAYVDNCGLPSGEPSSASHGSALIEGKDAISQQLVSLCELMSPCGYILYGTSAISKEILQKLNAKIVAELLKWKASLPPMLHMDLDDDNSHYLPHVLLLHMQYHQSIIYAHRPWISKSHLQPYPPRGPGYSHAREMCIQSAIAISKILSMYENRYTLRRINVQAVFITSSATLFLLFAAFSNCSSHLGNISLHLTTCFRALDEFTLSWKSAQTAKDLLVGLQRQWDLRMRSNKAQPWTGGLSRTTQ
ncbi:hypothetical protein BO83DRAFT_367912 [Aspergillus eucalypticola CBS 122712]|uniref:Zn(2)-C6 fungal-type domain-containing protein n=1 Tax=Aspergillus eucalypticola (strain CBS 122712 / IBT 29274) TaxID=1448314 RepID=A0A317UVF0_ASPEC|nr:uncharacterized protein BO83DRAFT_367912 [Aspergillus eucalypticola CBS 122712]PWY65416.1 hypothetical protein BO83DRAFT_367912 [Aspergillus eucalypticola CBS 122712]